MVVSARNGSQSKNNAHVYLFWIEFTQKESVDGQIYHVYKHTGS